MVITSAQFNAVKDLSFREVELVVFGRNFEALMDTLRSAERSKDVLDGLKASMESVKTSSFKSSHRQIQDQEVASLILTVLDRIQPEEDDAS